MTTPRPALPLLAALVAAALARGQEPPAPVKLEYRFEKLAGKTATYVVEAEQRVAQEMKGAADAKGGAGETGGGEVTSRVRQTLEQRFERADKGGGLVHITTRRIEATLERAGVKHRWDSAGGGPPPDAFAGLAKKVGVTATLEVSRQGIVEKVRGVPPGERSAWKTSFLELPERPLGQGQGWDRLERQPMEPLGTLVFHFRYVLAAPPAGEARRRIEATIRATLDDVLPTQRALVELTDQAGEGHLVLDEDGLVRESLLESRIELTVKAPAGTQVQRVRNRTSQALTELKETPPPGKGG